MAVWSRSRKDIGSETLSALKSLFRGRSSRTVEPDELTEETVERAEAAMAAASVPSREPVAPEPEAPGHERAWAEETRSGDTWRDEVPPEDQWPAGGAAELWPEEDAGSQPRQAPTVEAPPRASKKAPPKAPAQQRRRKVGRATPGVARDSAAMDSPHDETDLPDQVEALHEAVSPGSGNEDMMAKREDGAIGEAQHEDAAAPGEGAAQAAVTRKRALVDAVTKASGQKKSVVKPVVDALLAELGEALGRGEMLVVPPLGKLSLAKSRERGASEVMTLKLRRTRPGEAAVADADSSSDDEAAGSRDTEE